MTKASSTHANRATATGSRLHATIPSQLCYWGVIDHTALGRRPTARQLGYLFERVLPVAIDGLHAVFSRIDDHTVIACAASHETIRTHTPSGAVTLRPESLPEFLSNDLERCSLDPTHSLNLLIGPHESLPVRRARTQWLTLTAAAIMVISGVIVGGLERRRSMLLGAALEARVELASVYTDGLPPSLSRLPPERRLTIELRRLRAAQSAEGSLTSSVDASHTMARVLAAWPEGVAVRTESVSTRDRTVSLTASVPDAEHAQRLIGAFGEEPGLRVTQNSTQRTREGLQIRLVVETVPPVDLTHVSGTGPSR